METGHRGVLLGVGEEMGKRGMGKAVEGKEWE